MLCAGQLAAAALDAVGGIRLAVGDQSPFPMEAELLDHLRLGFAVQHVDRENMEPLLDVLQAHMDIETLEEELDQLDT